MKNSIIYEMLDIVHINDYRDTLYQEKNNFAKWVSETKDELEKNFDKTQLELIEKYENRIRTRDGSELFNEAHCHEPVVYGRK